MYLWLYLIPFVLVLGAQLIIKATYNKYKVILNRKGLTGFDIARTILDKNGLNEIPIIETAGELTDHFDPRRKTVKLSRSVYRDTTVAAAAISAHECGHVIQHKNKYIPMLIRGAIVPFVNFSSKIGYVILVIGFIASIYDLIIWGIILLCAALIFQLITLPVEFNASKRAIALLEEYQLIEVDEKKHIKVMLMAAAFTYVASLIATMLEIIRLFLMASRRRS